MDGANPFRLPFAHRVLPMHVQPDAFVVCYPWAPAGQRAPGSRLVICSECGAKCAILPEADAMGFSRVVCLDCSDARLEARREERMRQLRDVQALLPDLLEYFEARADADYCDRTERAEANEETNFARRIRRLLYLPNP